MKDKIKEYRKSFYNGGFTLVELLAVIVILAIIMLIAIPAVLNTLTVAKRKSFVEYVDKIFMITQKQVVEEETMGNPVVGCKTYYIKKDLGLTSTGNYDGFVLVKNDGFNDIAYYITLHDDEYKVESYLYDGSLDTENLEYYNSEDEVDNMLACASAGCSSCSMDGDVSATEICSSITQVNDSNPGSFAGSGTEVDPYKLESIEDLVALSKGTNDGSLEKYKYYKLMVDLSFACDKSYVDPSGTSFGDINGDGTTASIKEELTSSLGWVPIGYGENYFSSSLDGNNKKIYGLYMNSSNKYSNLGFIGYMYVNLDSNYSFYIKNLSLLDVNIKGSSSKNGILLGNLIVNTMNSKIDNIKLSGEFTCEGGSYCGGVLGAVDSYRQNYDSNFVINNCINKTNIVSKVGTTGGIVGQLYYGKLSNSYNYGNINGNAMLGGVIGYAAYKSNISNLYNYGTIIGNSSHQGGVVGYSNGVVSIDKMYNYGEVTNTSNTYHHGGVIGEANAEMVTNVYNYGKLTSSGSNIGGAIGYLYYSKAYNIYNYGNVNIKRGGGGYNGGVVGNQSSSDLHNAGNLGNINHESAGRLGGVVGNVYGECTNVYNLGNITSKKPTNNGEYIGGIVAYGSCSNCYNVGNIEVSYDSLTNNKYESIGLVGGYYSPQYNAGNNIFSVGTIKNNNGPSDLLANYYGGVYGYAYDIKSSNIYVKSNIYGYPNVGIVFGAITNSNTSNNIYVDMYSDASVISEYRDETYQSTGQVKKYYANLNNSPNKKPFSVADEYDFSQVNGMWFRDTLKLGNNWQYSNGYYPKLYKVLPNGSVSSELVEGQKDIPFK